MDAATRKIRRLRLLDVKQQRDAARRQRNEAEQLAEQLRRNLADREYRIHNLKEQAGELRRQLEAEADAQALLRDEIDHLKRRLYDAQQHPHPSPPVTL